MDDDDRKEGLPSAAPGPPAAVAWALVVLGALLALTVMMNVLPD